MMNEDKTLVGELGVLLAVGDSVCDTFSPSVAFNVCHLLDTRYGASTTRKADFGLSPLQGTSQL